MEIKQGTNRFYVGESETNDLARITYIFESDNVININHTYVSPDLRGKGVAGKLLQTLVTYVRENNLFVIPTCSYAVLKLTRNDEYEDILYKK